MPQSPKELERIGEEDSSEMGKRFELEDTAVETTPPEVQGAQIALKSALNKEASAMDEIASFPEAFAPGSAVPFSPKKFLSLSSQESWKCGKTLAARRHRTRSTSPSMELTKELADMGDSLNWRLSVLHKLNAIQYAL